MYSLVFQVSLPILALFFRIINLTPWSEVLNLLQVGGRRPPLEVRVVGQLDVPPSRAADLDHVHDLVCYSVMWGDFTAAISIPKPSFKSQIEPKNYREENTCEILSR